MNNLFLFAEFVTQKSGANDTKLLLLSGNRYKFVTILPFFGWIFAPYAL
jgi:hypothetical protein